MKFTPNDIEIIIHYYVSPVDHPRAAAPAVQQSIKMFQDNGLLDIGLKITPKGMYWIEMLLSTPFPELKWIDPREEKGDSK